MAWALQSQGKNTSWFLLWSTIAASHISLISKTTNYVKSFATSFQWKGFVCRFWLVQHREGWESKCSQNPGIARKGGLTFARIFFEDLSTMHWGPSKVIIYHQKVIVYNTCAVNTHYLLPNFGNLNEFHCCCATKGRTDPGFDLCLNSLHETVICISKNK